MKSNVHKNIQSRNPGFRATFKVRFRYRIYQKQPLKLKSFERMHKKEEIPLHVIIMIIIEYYSFVFTHLV